MPFKGMLKWAVAKEDHPSKSKASTKSLKKRRKLSHHHHYCSILKSSVCLRTIENAAAAALAVSSASSTKPPSSLSPSALTKGQVEDTKSSCKLISLGGDSGSSSSSSSTDSSSGASNTITTNNNNNNNVNCCRGLHHQRSSTSTSSSSRFRLKVARHWSSSTSANTNKVVNMGNNNSVPTLVKSADKTDERDDDSSSSPTQQLQCTACPSGNSNIATSNIDVDDNNIPNNNANNNTSNKNNNNPTNLNNARNSQGKTATSKITTTASMSVGGGKRSPNVNGAGGRSSCSSNNADSKSLLYMSLDHLPLAIVKQYERMLQESTTMEAEQPQPSPPVDFKEDKMQMKTMMGEKSKKVTKNKSKKVDSENVKKKGSTDTSNNEILNVAPSSPPVIKNRPSIIKQKQGSNNNNANPNNQGVVVSHSKKITIISPPKSKKGTSSCTVQTEQNMHPINNNNNGQECEPTKKPRTQNQSSSTTCKNQQQSTKSSTFSSIKEARNRPLQVHSNGSNDISPLASPKKKSESKSSKSTKRKSPPPELPNEKCTQTTMSTSSNSPKPKSRFKVTIVNSPISSSSSTSYSTTTTSSSSNSPPINGKAIGVNEVETKDACCETEPKLFPLKSILKDCKSSTLPRTKRHDSSASNKPKKSSGSSSSTSSSDSSQKNVPIHGRSSSFRSSGEKVRSLDLHGFGFGSPVSSRKPFQSLHNVSIVCEEERKSKAPLSFPPSSPSQSLTESSMVFPPDKGATNSFYNNKTILNDHDITDPQFLEEPVPVSTPAVSRCAKKLTLKRSDVRKLERIRTQTEKLNRFLKKYYNDCLPNLPEEEEEQCSPEEKSVHLSVLRKHWIEKIPEESSTSSTIPRFGSARYLQNVGGSSGGNHGKISRQRRATLPHTDISTAAAIEEAARVLAAGESLAQNADSSQEEPISPTNNDDNAIRRRNNKNSSLLSSSAYYSDPILSSLPIIIEDPEILFQRKQQLEKQQQQQNHVGKSNKISTSNNGCSINITTTTRSSSCSSVLINNNKNHGMISTSSCSSTPLNPPESRRCSSVSTTSSSSCSCSCSSCNSSTTSSIINLANEFRMAEVIRHDNNIHESFLMSTHNFPLEDNSLLLLTDKEFGGGIARCIPTLNDEHEHLHTERNNHNCESAREQARVEEGEGGSSKIDSFGIAPSCEQPFTKDLVVVVAKTKSDNNNNDDGNEDESSKNKRSTSRSNHKNKKVMIPFASCNSVGSSITNSSGSSSCSNSINSVDEEAGIIGEGAENCFGPEKLKGFSCTSLMMMGREEPLGNPFDVPTSLAEDEGFMSPYPPEAYSPASSASTASLLNRLSISSGKGSAEDYDDERRLELFFLDSSCETSMVEQQIAAYKEQQQQLRFQIQPELIVSGEKSHHLLHRGQSQDECEDEGKDHVGGVINISSIYQNEKSCDQFENAAAKVDDESPDNIQITEIKHRPQQPIPSSRIPFPIPKPRRTSIMIENSNYLSFDGNETWNSHDYATIGGSSSSSTSGSTSTYAACGSFFPNPNLLGNHHERQVSSDSSAYSVLNECENVVNHHHQCHEDHHDHKNEYDEVPSNPKRCGDNDYHNDNNNDDYEVVDDDDEETQQEEGEQEESVIIQSSGSTTGGAGIAFSTPIHPRLRRPTLLLQNASRMMMVKNSNYSQCSSITANSFLSKSSFCSSAVSAVSNRSISSRRKYQNTPRKVVRKPPVNTPFSDKGEVLIRCYRNGDYVTVHVVQAKNLQICYRSSWKLSMKISLIPEGEATFTKSESVLVPRARRFVKIDQKFSFEIPQKRKSHHHDHTESNCAGGAAKTLDGSRREQRKLFLTFVKRIEKRSTFLGWTSLQVPDTENTTQAWLKLRKRKMSSVSYPAHSSSAVTSNQLHSSSAPGLLSGHSPVAIVTAATPPGCGGVAPPTEAMVGLPSHIETLEQAVPSVPSRSCKSPECYEQEYIGKTQLQNSSTMDSGVEDCCEPPPVPSIELDDKLGFRVRVHMTKPEGSGFGFSVVWVAPPRIERLEKDKTADLAGLKIGDLIIGVNGEDVTTVPNTVIYNKMKSTGKALDLEIWRKHPHVASPLPPHMTSANIPHPVHPAALVQPPPPPPTHPSSGTISSLPPNNKPVVISNPASTDYRDHRPTAHNSTTTALPQTSSTSYNCNGIKNSPGLPNTAAAPGGLVAVHTNPLLTRITPQPPPPTSILKPPPPAPPVSSSNLGNSCPSQSQQPTTASSSWRIRFNIELLDNEDDYLKQFFICELKFFRKVVAALDRYLIPAQASRLLTPQEIHLIFAQVIKIITMTKRILQCVANGSNSSTWKLGRILLSTHSDHLPEITSAYTAYARSLGYSATILSEKMSIQDFAKFILETTVPKGHLDMTSLLFAPFEHLRNLCEICEEISHHHDNWIFLNSRLKECYADIVCETDFMEPISHLSMKKNPLLSVRDLEKRIISTTSQQPLKVCEKGRKWLFGSRLYRRENDGSWSPVWAFLFTDIIVLTSHMTRDRVFFVKETPIRLDSVVTLHFNLPKKHENEFRLLFGSDNSHHSRLDRILPLRSKKSNQVVLRTANVQLKCLWNLLLQRQIISLNTKLSKSSSSNFSISEFCEKFPVVQHDSIMEEDEEKLEVEATSYPTKASQQHHQLTAGQVTQNPRSNEPHPRILSSGSTPLTHKPQPDRAIQTHSNLVQKNGVVVNVNPALKMTTNQQSQITGSEIPPVGEVPIQTQTEKNVTITSPNPKPYVPDGLSSINRDFMRARGIRSSTPDRRSSIPGAAAAVTAPALGSDEKGQSQPSAATTTSLQSPKVTTRSSPATDRIIINNANQSNKPEVFSSSSQMTQPQPPPPSSTSAKACDLKTSKIDTVPTSATAKVPSVSRPSQHDASTSTFDNLPNSSVLPFTLSSSSNVPCTIPPVPKARTSLSNAAQNTPTHSAGSRTTTPAPENSAPSPIPSHNNNNTIDVVNHEGKDNSAEGKCPCEKVHERESGAAGVAVIMRQDTKEQQPTAYPSPKPRQLSNLKRMSSKEDGTTTMAGKQSHTNILNNDEMTVQGSLKMFDNGVKGDGPKMGNELQRKGGEKNENFSPEVALSSSRAPATSNTMPSSSTVKTHSYANEGVVTSKEKYNEQIPEALQSPLMVKRAHALASGTATPSSSSSLSPARGPSTSLRGNSYKGSETQASNPLLNDGVNNALKSKPGSRIMTNAILKSRQQELIAQSLHTTTSVSTETLRTEKSSDTTASTSKTDSSTQYFSLKEESTTTSSCSTTSQSMSQPPQQIMVRCIHNKNIVVHHQHHSHHCPGSCGSHMINPAAGGGAIGMPPGSPNLSVPPPRCHSENSHHPKKSKPVHTDSPILSGYGSERARRRMLFDNKIRKDYPELFGITPKDRRSFIKQLGEKDLSSKGLVAPYYYTMSPVPIPKHVMMTMGNCNDDDDLDHDDGSSISTNTREQESEFDIGNKKSSSPLVIPPFNPNSQAKAPIKSNEERVTDDGISSSGMISGISSSSKRIEKSSSSSNTVCSSSSTQTTTVTTPTLKEAGVTALAEMNSRGFQEGSMVHTSTSTPATRVGELASGMGRGDDGDVDTSGIVSHPMAHDVYQASLELDEEGQRLKDFVEKMREEMTGMDDDDEDDDEDDDDEDDEEEEEEEEDSDDSTAGGQEDDHGQSHRSHEESSNDSGISDEMTEKSKTTLSGLLEEDEDQEGSLSISRRNENFSNMLDRMRSGVLAAEVKNPNPDKISVNSPVSVKPTTPVANNTVHSIDSSIAPVVHDDDVVGADVKDGNKNVDANVCSPNNDAKNKTQFASANHPSHVCCTNKSHVADEPTSTLCFLEGETKASMETMVVLKADKATETEDDDFNFLLAMNSLRECSHTSHNIYHPQHQKPLRSILAERREAFFLSQQTSFTSHHCPYSNNNMSTATMSGHSIHFAEESTFIPHYQYQTNHCPTCSASLPQHTRAALCASSGVSGGGACVNCASGDHQNNRDPLIVKIVDGGTLHSLDEGGKKDNENNPPCERVQLQRLERQRKPKVERVESSEDSTSSSSDLASASPAAENGTTDPSWSSSSSSLAGYASSKEEPALALSVPNSITTTVAVAPTLAASSAVAPISSVSSSSTSVPETVVATSACSQFSNTSKVDDGSGGGGSLSSGSSFSASAQTNTDSSGGEHEPSSSYQSSSSKSYSLLLDTEPKEQATLLERQLEEQELIDEEAAKSSSISSCSNSRFNDHDNASVINTNHEPCTTNGASNIASSSCSQNSTQSKKLANIASSSSTTNSEINQSFENSELDSSTTCSSISTSSKVPLLKSTTKSNNNNNSSTTSTTNSSSSFCSRSSSSSGAPPPSSSRVVVVSCGGFLSQEDDSQEEGEGSSERCARTGPEIVVTQESDPEESSSHSSNDDNGNNTRHGYSSDGEEDSIVLNGKAVDSVASDENGGGSSAGEGGSGCSSSNQSSNHSAKGFLRVESNDSTAENYGDDDDYNFDDDEDEDDLSHCSVATINRYGTFESLEKLESEDTVGGLPEFPRGSMPRSKARFTFEDDDDDDDDDLFEEDFESDFNFRFPSQIQDNTYSVSRLGPLPPLLEEDYEDEMYDEQRASAGSPSSSSGMGEYSGGVGGSTTGGCGSGEASLRTRHEVSTMAIQGVSLSPATITASSNIIMSSQSSLAFPSCSLVSTSTSAQPASSSSPSTSLSSTPLTPRAQKLVVIKSSSDMIVMTQAGAGDSKRSTSSLTGAAAGLQSEVGQGVTESPTLLASAPTSLASTLSAAFQQSVDDVARNTTNTSI